MLKAANKSMNCAPSAPDALTARRLLKRSAVYKFFLIRYRNTLLTIQIDGSHGEY